MGEKLSINIFETTGRCRYTSICDSFQTMVRAEKWVERDILKIRTEFDQPDQDSESLSLTLQYRLNEIERIKERCYKYNHRCLRFWQFKRKEENKPLLSYKHLDLSLRRLDDQLLEENMADT